MAHKNTPSSIVSRLAYLEKELRKVKHFAERQSLGQGAKKSTPLRGILKGIRIEPEEIEQTKKSVFLPIVVSQWAKKIRHTLWLRGEKTSKGSLAEIGGEPFFFMGRDEKIV